MALIAANTRLGKALSERGRYREAQEAYQSSLRLAPSNVIARRNLAQVGEGGDDANRAVSAHAQVAAVVEKNHARSMGRVGGLAQQGTHHDIAAARLQHGGSAPIVVAAGQ